MLDFTSVNRVFVKYLEIWHKMRFLPSIVIISIEHIEFQKIKCSTKGRNKYSIKMGVAQ